MSRIPHKTIEANFHWQWRRRATTKATATFTRGGAGVEAAPSSGRRTRAVNFRIDLPVVSRNSSAISEVGFAFKE